MIPFSLYLRNIFISYDQEVLQMFLLFSLYFSSLNLKYLKFTKMELTRVAMKLFSHLQNILGVSQKEILYNCNVKWQFMMANYEIAEFIAIMQVIRTFE